MSKVLCTCAVCREKVCYDGDQEYSGQLLRPRIHKQHMKIEAKREASQDAISGRIMLAAASKPPSRQPSMSLPVRRRDSEMLDEVHERGSAPPPTVQQDPTEIIPEPPPSASASGSSLAERTATITMRQKTISDLFQTVDQVSKSAPKVLALTFTQQPQSLSDPAPEPAQTQFVGAYNWLVDQRRYVEEVLVPLGDRNADSRRLALLGKLNGVIQRLEGAKQRAWSQHLAEWFVRSRLSGKSGPLLAKGDQANQALRKALQPFILAVLIMASVMHALAATSRPFMRYMLVTVQVALFGAFMSCNTNRRKNLTADQSAILDTLPDDIRTVLKTLGLEPDFVRYACCPTCFAIYAPDPDKPDDPFPHTCTFRETDRKVCGSSLVYRQQLDPDDNGTVRHQYAPVLTYPYRMLESWLVTMLSRPGVLEHMKRAWKPNEGTAWKDIFDAPGLQDFKGPDGVTPFSIQPDGSVHLVFSLFIDWFNPFGNKKAGKSHSIGAIYLVCMNLPDHLRYRPENIYLAGIMPGPKEPQLHQINHLLRPLIDELLVLWHRGMIVADVLEGQLPVLVRGAVIPLVCDLPAIRKTAGFASHSAAHFCSFCELTHDNINDLNRSEWKRHSWEDHVRFANEWRDLPTEKARKDHFDEHGIRWSELLRLGYWDPTRFAVVDAMHNLFLGELRHHCRDVWGIDVKDKTKETKKMEPHDPDRQRTELQKAVNAILRGVLGPLKRLRKGYIVAIADMNNVAPITGALTKAAYGQALIDWAAVNGNVLMVLPVLQEDTVDFHLADGPHDISKYRVLDQATVDAVRADIAATYLPSWLERPPKNFGSASHGKLKADQWRTVCTVSLVITLTRLWGTSNTLEKYRLILDNFLSLVCAVDLATRRTTNPERIKKFDEHMFHYLDTLRTVFDHQFVPNHHLSLHLHECLLLFGPVHAWWAFPFERYNGLLQRLNTNNKTNEMPLTFMRYFYLGAHLRWLMSTTVWPKDEQYKKMAKAYNEAVLQAKTAGGVRVADFVPFGESDEPRDADHDAYKEAKEVMLPKTTYKSLCSLMSKISATFSTASTSGSSNPTLHTHVNYVRHVARSGMTFATRTSGLRNSFVLFNDPLHPSDNSRAGQISDIFLHARRENGQQVVEPFVLINEYQPLQAADVELDPYRRYPDLETRLFYNKFEPKQRLVRFRDISSHFAALIYKPEDIGAECIVVRSLNRD